MSERDPQLYGTDELALSLLNEAEVWAVVGLGNDPSKAAYRVAAFLQSKGKRIVPVYPRDEMVLGEPTFKTLAEAQAVAGRIDVVDCFVNARRVGSVVDEAIALGLPAVWMQLDIVDEDAAQRAVDQGIAVIMDRCPAIEWPRLIGA